MNRIVCLGLAVGGLLLCIAVHAADRLAELRSTVADIRAQQASSQPDMAAFSECSLQDFELTPVEQLAVTKRQ